ncbi:hypothetical protein IAT40_004377 [Kwoniella sp. CBS 6097]
MGSLLSQPMPGQARAAAAPATTTQSSSEATAVPAPPPSILSYFFPAPSPSLSHDHLKPTLKGILLVMGYLQKLGLPTEIAQNILDQAEYYAACRRHISKKIEVCSTCEVGHVKNEDQPFSSAQQSEVNQQALRVGGGLRNKEGMVWYLCSSLLGCTGVDVNSTTWPSRTKRKSSGSSAEDERLREQEVWLRKVVVETFSKDQGWSSGNAAHYGTYQGSYSWFEISLIRGADEVEGSRHTVQHNVHAGQYFKTHRNILQPDHPTLRLAQPGDQIVLWVRAQYPGWKNLINEAAITVFFSPYPPT